MHLLLVDRIQEGFNQSILSASQYTSTRVW